MGWHQIRVTIRMLLRAPAFALASILTIALAVGMATSVFSVVNAILLRPLPYKDAGRLAVIWSSSRNESRGPVSFDDFEDWRRDSTTLESAPMYSSYFKPVLSGQGDPVRVAALLVSHQYFNVMGVKPILAIFPARGGSRRAGQYCRSSLWVLIYGVVSYSVAQRTSEFGIRAALGARPADVVREAMVESLRANAFGLAAGLVVSYGIATWIAEFLFDVSATDTAMFALVAFLGLVSIVACYIPARRAASIDPLMALRSEQLLVA